MASVRLERVVVPMKERPMDLAQRTYPCLAWEDATPRIRLVSARIRERGQRGYRLERSPADGRPQEMLYRTFAEARAALDETETAAARAIELEVGRARQRLLTHRWWARRPAEPDLDRILETAVIHTEGAVLVDPQGGYAWAPPGAWHMGRHLRIDIPPEGHSLASAALAFLSALDEACKRDEALRQPLACS
jgi:hypothetical protein